MTTKKKWAIGVGVFLALGLLGAILDDDKSSTSGENKAEPQQSEQTEQKQETKAEPQQSEQTEQKQETKTEKKESEEVQSEQKQENSFLGTYEVTDVTGCKVTLNINEDETVTGSNEYGSNFYGSWTGPTGVGIIINFAETKPYLIFEGGKDKYMLPVFYLRDGWIYTGGENASAKNPKWRLKVTKIK